MAQDIKQQFKTFLKMKKYMTPEEKGAAGEELAISIVRRFPKKVGGFMIAGYKFPYAKKKNGDEYPGNLVLNNGRLVSYEYPKTPRRNHDEIDLLVVTKYSIIVIECKAYGSSSGIQLYDHWWKYDGSGTENKYPLGQCEKHCRHLYHQLWDLLPQGQPSYIKPLVVFVDRQRVKDLRSPEMQRKIHLATANTLLREVYRLSKASNYYLNTEAIENRLKALRIGGKVIK
jgi:hypothetical protein